MLDQGNNFYLISLNILISCLLSNVRILLGEVSCWSLLGVKGLNKFSLSAPNVEERVWRMRILMSGEWCYLLKMMINDADDYKLYDNWQTAGSLSLGVLLVITGLRQTDTIYSNPCNDCDNIYIRQTKCHFGTRLREYQKAVFFCKKENSSLLEHTCLTNHTIGWDKSKIITTNQRYHQCLCLEAWHINSAHAPSNCDDGGLLLDAYLHLVRKKGAN